MATDAGAAVAHGERNTGTTSPGENPAQGTPLPGKCHGVSEPLGQPWPTPAWILTVTPGWQSYRGNSLWAGLLRGCCPTPCRWGC